MIAGFSKPRVPIPNEERFKSILFQIELITAIHRGNEDFYGTLKYHTVHYADSSLYVPDRQVWLEEAAGTCIQDHPTL